MATPVRVILTLSALVMISIACGAGAFTPTQPAQPPPPPEAVEAAADAPGTGDTTALLANADLAALYDRVSPGVVAIRVLSAQGGGLGSGFVLDEQGHIVTNYHVVADTTDLEVDFSNGIKARGEVIGIDLDSDLAIVLVDLPPEQLHPLVLGDSDLVRVGQVVAAIGNPFGLSGTMTVGIVSAKGRVLASLNLAPGGGIFSAGDLIQTDAAINPGNSGGPLLNLDGEVIGLNRAIQTDTFNAEGQPANNGIGFAISVNIIKRVAPSLIANGSYEYPYLGLTSLPEITLFIQEDLGLPQSTGALVTEAINGGPAAEAGVQIGDLIVAIDGRPVLIFGDLLAYMLVNKSPGDSVTLSILRGGESLDVTVVLGSRP